MAIDLVSIIVPVYNKEPYIYRAIESILHQTYSELDVLLINDGSTDKSGEICKEFAVRDSRVRYLNKVNGGVSSARNLGIKKALGKYITFVDADDSIEPVHVERLVNAIVINQCRVSVLLPATIRPPSRDILNIKTISGQRAIDELFLLRFPSSMCAYMYSKDLINEISMCEDIHFFEDFLYNYEVLSACNVIALLNICTYNYSINESSVNKTGLNPKRMSCLKIFEYLEKKGGDFTKNTDQCTFFKAHCLISLLLAAANTINWEEYDAQLKATAISILYESIKSRFVPLSYKLLLILSSLNLKLAVGICRLRTKGRAILFRMSIYRRN